MANEVHGITAKRLTAALCAAGVIGGAIASLLSENSGWINAQRIEVSGGMYI